MCGKSQNEADCVCPFWSPKCIKISTQQMIKKQPQNSNIRAWNLGTKMEAKCRKRNHEKHQKIDATNERTSAIIRWHSVIKSGIHHITKRVSQ
jgi:hypothetical protein